MLAEQTLQAFTAGLASSAPTPGGGGASAMAGALGAALGAMAANLTKDKPKYAAYRETIEACSVHLTEMAGQLISLIDEDVAAFEPLAAAYGMPRGTETEKAQKNTVLQLALYEAAQPPRRMMISIMQALEVLTQLVDLVSPLVISDIGCGAALARGALAGAALNIYINANMLDDQSLAGNLAGEAQDRLEAGTAMADAIYQKVVRSLCS